VNDREKIKPIVRGCYDIQKLRIEMGNRIVAVMKHKLGQNPGETEQAIDLKGQIILKTLRSEHKRIADGAKTISLKSLSGYELISDMADFAMANHYESLCRAEEDNFKFLEKVISEVPIYKDWMKDVKGIGRALAGVIISEIDISKATYPSSLWKYAGLDVGPDGRGRSRRKEHLIDQEYIDREGKAKTKKSITFNPFLKTKLCGILGPSFLKCKSPYADLYYDYRNRLENHPAYKDDSKGHRHNMAIRYIVKMFLKDLYIQWRTAEGLSVADMYSEAKLGIKHSRVA